MKFTSNLLMSLHLEEGGPMVNGKWLQSPYGPTTQALLTASCWERVSESHTSSAGGTFWLPCHTAA